MASSDFVDGPTRDELVAELEAVTAERNALADELTVVRAILERYREDARRRRVAQ